MFFFFFLTLWILTRSETANGHWDIFNRCITRSDKKSMHTTLKWMNECSQIIIIKPLLHRLHSFFSPQPWNLQFYAVLLAKRPVLFQYLWIQRCCWGGRNPIDTRRDAANLFVLVGEWKLDIRGASNEEETGFRVWWRSCLFISAVGINVLIVSALRRCRADGDQHDSLAEAELLHRRYARWRSLPWSPGGLHTLLDPLSSTLQINTQ